MRRMFSKNQIETIAQEIIQEDVYKIVKEDENNAVTIYFKKGYIPYFIAIKDQNSAVDTFSLKEDENFEMKIVRNPEGDSASSVSSLYFDPSSDDEQYIYIDGVTPLNVTALIVIQAPIIYMEM